MFDWLITVGWVLGGIFVLVALLLAAAAVLRRERVRARLASQVVLTIEVPKENDKSPLAAEQLFASMHGLYRNLFSRILNGQISFSFEIEARKGQIRFHVCVPKILEEFVSKQVYAQYPNAKLVRSEDYVDPYSTQMLERESQLANIQFQKPLLYPIRTFNDFEVDPLSGITSGLSGLGENESVYLQMVISPEGSGWQKSAHQFVDSVRRGDSNLMGAVANNVLFEIWGFLVGIIKVIMYNRADYEVREDKVNLSDSESLALKLVETKSTKLGYRANLRLWTTADTSDKAQQLKEEFISTLQQFTLSNLNGFKLGRRIFNKASFKEDFKKRRPRSSKVILNTEELASVFHLPDASVETPNIVWSRARKGEPPANLPVTSGDVDHGDLTIFAQTDFRHEERKFGIKQADRLRHTYVIGKTGMGKSTMLSNMAIDDIRSGRGLAVVDPHGDLIETILQYVPNRRANDVILFNPADRDFPVALNMLEAVDQSYKNLVASGLIAVFYKMYANSWGPRLEHILRNTILALLDAPDSTLLGIPRMLTDKQYRERIKKTISNPTVAMFWEKEFPQIETSRSSADSLGAIQNKVGQFLSSPIIRNIVGQTQSTIDLRAAMDSNKIILVNLSKGLIGEDTSALLGSMLITKIQLAAMSRSDVPEADRVPFYLYVDEFQNFATSSFATILSEARKYKLGLTMANQYIAQMPEDVRDAVFGNVGTLISFAVGATDAKYIAQEFNPTFSEEDLVHLDKYNIYLRMTIDGINSEPYSATTLPLPVNSSNNQEKVLRLSRERYSKPADKVEENINVWSGYLPAGKKQLSLPGVGDQEEKDGNVKKGKKKG